MPTPTYDLIASSTLSSAASSITLSGISGSYRDIALVARATKDTAGGDNFVLRFNDDTGNNYNFKWGEMYSTSSQWAGSALSQSRIITSQSFSAFSDAEVGILEAHILEYSQTDKNKNVLIRSGRAGGGSTFGIGEWMDTSAITSITLTTTASDFAAGTTLSIYGVIA